MRLADTMHHRSGVVDLGEGVVDQMDANRTGAGWLPRPARSSVRGAVGQQAATDGLAAAGLQCGLNVLFCGDIQATIQSPHDEPAFTCLS